MCLHLTLEHLGLLAEGDDDRGERPDHRGGSCRDPTRALTHRPRSVSIPTRTITSSSCPLMPGSPGPAEQLACLGLGQAGLLAADLHQYQVRLWHSFHRHTVVSLCAQALLAAVAAARHAPPRPAMTARRRRRAARGLARHRQAARYRRRPVPGDDPGLLKVSVPEGWRPPPLP